MRWVSSGALPWVGSLVGLGPGWHICCPGETPQTSKTSNLKNLLDPIYRLDHDDLDFGRCLHLTSNDQYDWTPRQLWWEFERPTGHWTVLMTLFNDDDSDFQGAPVGSADEPGLPVQEETDQRGQTNKAVGTWRPTGDFLISALVWWWLDWLNRTP